MTVRPSLTMILLTKESVCAGTMGSYMYASISQKLQNRVLLKQRIAMGQSDLPKARSEHLSIWYTTAQPKDLFLYVDSDQTFTEDDILKSVELCQKHDVVCGVYVRKTGWITCEPFNLAEFISKQEGELTYGSTGFMMITYEICDRLVKEAYKNVKFRTSINTFSYPFFYERIVSEKMSGENNLWLSEDYSLCWSVRNIGGKVYGYISPTIGHIIPYEKYVELPRTVIWPKNSIVFHCSNTAEPWSPESLKKGIGGSELAVIKLAQEWRKMGYRVFVYCNCEPGIFDDVEYKKTEMFSVADVYDILIFWRSPEVFSVTTFNARKIILDLHDVVNPEKLTDRAVQNVDKICVKSKYHADQLYHRKLIGSNTEFFKVPENKVAIIPNGGAHDEDIPIADKDPNYLIYTSSYDRGLLYMLKWGWPKIKAACPKAKLGVFYGWGVYDSSTLISAEEKSLYKKMVNDLLLQNGIENHERVSREEILLQKQKASIHYYTGDWPEIDCISIRESAWLGCIPVVSYEQKVFQEKEYCIKIRGDPHTQKMQEEAADFIIDLLKSPEMAENIRNKLVVPKTESWPEIAKEWEKLFV